ncbi:MAG TPA: CRTAC1 family protein [Planctomycetaceae bacterium]|nr:CRTAC1 family protein [Planctomycetaceae bacterium]
MNEPRSPQQPDPRIDPETEERDDAVIGTALRWSLVGFVVLALGGGAVAWYLTRPEPSPPVKESKLAETRVRELPEVEIPTTPFADVTREAGITFVHENGAYGDKLLPETMGGGVAFFDFDNDGHQDLLFVNSQRWPWDPRPNQPPPATMALYRNDGRGNFQDVTAGSGLDVSLYGMGVAVGDFDGDGLVDVFISALGPNRLFRNLGGGKFEDVTGLAGVAGGDQEWSTSCGWFDYDRDGDLDLFVCNYLKWSKGYDLAQPFTLLGVGGRAYGRPQDFEGTFPYLYRNDGGGKFTDVSAAAGVQVKNADTGVPTGKSLGVTFADFDGDGWMDILVANDTVQNFLLHNQRDGTFREMAAPAGVAYDMRGNARGAMGVDSGWFRNSDALGVAIGNFATEETALYVARNRELLFVDEAMASGLGPTTRDALTFGVCFFDYDLDGRLDLLCANGHLEDEINKVQASQHYEQPPQLFWNAGPQHGTEFLKVPAANCGSAFLAPMVGRGVAFADIDGDGDLDVLLTATGKAPRLLRNEQQLGHHWLRFRLRGRTSNPDAIGAWVEVKLNDAEGRPRSLRQQVMPTRSYLSQVELLVTFGLGQADRVEEVVVHWPDGTSQPLRDVAVDRLHTIEQDTGAATTAQAR